MPTRPLPADLPDIVARLLALPRGDRHIIAIAGPPGSGKSTVADRIANQVNARDPGRAAILPMDGYHFDDMLLDQLGRKPFKGAPDTFDVGGLAAMITRLRQTHDEPVAVPVFDRDIEIARAGARLIPPEADCLIVEGNYLLLTDAPWNRLAPLFDLSILVLVPEHILRQRLTDRWQGYDLTPTQIAHKLDQVDLPNGRMVMSRSATSDLTLEN